MAAPSSSSSREEIKLLMKKKQDIEEEMEEMNKVLQSQQDVGMEAPLVDKDGFPRSDVDVYSVRHARHRIICLQNDHKAVMKEIEEDLHRLHAQARQGVASSDTPTTAASTASPPPPPFAAVARVDTGSPASASGLEVGDQIVEFGSISARNFTGLKGIGELVQHSKGKAVRVRVLRGGQVTPLTLTPNTWSGPGLLGCNIVPVPK